MHIGWLHMTNVLEQDNINKSIEAYTTTGYTKHYERYDFLYEKMKPHLGKESLKVLDIGCGDSSFIYYMKKRHPNFKYYGLEISQELIDKAKNEPFLKDITLIKGDARDFKIDEKFDIVIMAGVLSIFDKFKPVLQNMINHMKSSGIGFIWGGFTRSDIDVIVRFRNNFLGSKIWESGLNMISLHTIKRALKPYTTDFEASEFNLKQKMEKQDNPIRTFTIETKEGKNLVVNGANIIRDFHVIKFVKK